MSLRYYMDHHVHSAIVAGLRRRGIECITAEEDGAKQLEDSALLGRATQLGCVLFSQDVDLLEIVAEWMRIGREFAGLVYARQLGITVGQAVRDLELMAKVLEAEEMRGRIEYLPL